MIMDMMLGVGVAPKPPPPPPLVFLFIINHPNGKAENMYHPLQIIGTILLASIYYLWRWVVVVERRRSAV